MLFFTSILFPTRHNVTAQSTYKVLESTDKGCTLTGSVARQYAFNFALDLVGPAKTRTWLEWNFFLKNQSICFISLHSILFSIHKLKKDVREKYLARLGVEHASRVVLSSRMTWLVQFARTF